MRRAPIIAELLVQPDTSNSRNDSSNSKNDSSNSKNASNKKIPSKAANNSRDAATAEHLQQQKR
jgi:hypothetical protein